MPWHCRGKRDKLDGVDLSLFLFHVKDIKDKKYGPIAGRRNAYFVNHRAYYRSGESVPSLERVSSRDYKEFGLHTDGDSRTQSYTERVAYMLRDESETSKKLPMKGTVGVVASSEKCTISLDLLVSDLCKYPERSPMMRLGLGEMRRQLANGS